MKKTIKPGEVLQIPAIPFLDKENVEVLLDKVLGEGDYWLHKNRSRGDAWIISHKGTEKLAEICGIKPPINSEFDLQVQGVYGNSMEHRVKATMFCEAMPLQTGENIFSPTKCIHGSDRVFYSIGESSRGSTNSPYYNIMADKRAYDRGVLQHLKLDGKVNIYSEAEAEDFEKIVQKPVDKIIQEYASLCNEIVNTASKEDLMRIAQNIKEMNIKDEQVLNYLREIWGMRNNKFTESF